MLKAERMDRVRAALHAQGLTQMIVCDPKSVWYCSCRVTVTVPSP